MGSSNSLLSGKEKHARPRKVIGALDELIKEHHLLKHPLYQAWMEGKLSKVSLQVYSEQLCHHVRTFPENLRHFSGRASMPLAGLVRDNLAGEMDRPARLQLWLQFARALGIPEERTREARLLPGVAALLDIFEEVSTQGSMAEAVSAFYAYEAQVPEISMRKMDGLRQFYEITEPGALAYLAAQRDTGAARRGVWHRWLNSQEEIDEFGALCSAQRTLKALWGALDAVHPQAYAAAGN